MLNYKDKVETRRKTNLKVGIVGTGIAGLTAGWLFEQDDHEVVLFEKLPSLGMAAHAFEIESKQGPCPIDVPPRMFNNAEWPNLVRLYDHIGVEYVPVDLSKSYSFFGEKSFLNLDASYKPKLGLSLLSKNVRQISADADKMMSQVSDLPGVGNGLTLREYLNVNQFSDTFVFEFLYPSLSSTVCTCSYQALDNYPASLLLNSLAGIIGNDLSDSRSLMRTRFGSLDVARRLAKNVADIRFGTTVVSATVESNQVKIVFDNGERQSEASFDHLIVATQANQSSQFLPALTEVERNTLNSFQYENIETIIHTDESQMPADQSNWAHFNFVICPEASMCSVWMNRFNHDSPFDGNVLQTISPINDVADEQVLTREKLQRPIVNQASAKAWEAIASFHREPDRRIWFCGSYATSGVPLLESGLVSSLNVAEAIGIEIPELLSPSLV